MRSPQIAGRVGICVTGPAVYPPRGSLTLFRASQARAALEGRAYVIPDDIKALAPFALAHRMIVSPSARIKDVDAESIVRDILASVPVPGGSVKPN